MHRKQTQHGKKRYKVTYAHIPICRYCVWRKAKAKWNGDKRMPVYLVVARDFAGNEVFKRVAYAKDKEEVIGVALHEENKQRTYKDRLLRSRQYYSIRELLKDVPGMDVPEESNKKESQSQ
jgi:hypothetical protein